MGNLASMIMEGSYGYGFGSLRNTYDHDNGASLIAMESAAALNAIFDLTMVIPNSCTIQAAREGVSVSESTVGYIMEGAIRDAWAKVKEFFIKLKDKVKAFLHNVKRYLLGIFGNAVKWVTQYEDELKDISDSELKGYKVSMYKYTNLDKSNMAKVGIDSVLEEFGGDIRLSMNNDKDGEDLDEILDTKYEKFLSSHFDVSDPDKLDKELWSRYRDGANSEANKSKVDIGSSKIKEYIKIISNSEDEIDTTLEQRASSIEKAYTKAIKAIDRAEKYWNDLRDNFDKKAGKDSKVYTITNNDEYKKAMLGKELGNANGKPYARNGNMVQNAGPVLGKWSSFISRCQTAENKDLTAMKFALTERNKTYMSALVNAFKYARKHKTK